MNKPPNDYDVLLDLRETTNRMTVHQIIQLVNSMTEDRSSFRNKLALLTKAGRRLDEAKFMELYAGNRGFRVEAFDNFEAAILWLSTVTTVAPQEG